MPTDHALTLSFADGIAGQAYSTTTITPAGGTAPYTFTVTGLPTGLTFSATNTQVTISGTPPQAGLYTVTATASASGCAGNITYKLVINRAGNTAGTVLISEARTSGPTGAVDEFVELYNNSDATVSIGGFALARMGNTCAAAPVTVATIPAGTNIPARGHYLLTGSAYSLTSYASSNQTLTAGLEDDANFALFNTTNAANFSPLTRLDAVGFGNNKGNYCDLLRENNTLPATGGSISEHSFVRQIKITGAGAGLPLDTNDNATNFALVSTDAALINGAQSILGAPGPENLSSPVLRDATVVPSLTDPLVCAACAPNRVRVGSGNSGTLSIRRHFVNQTGAAITRLRFRIIDITTLGNPVITPPQAQLKFSNSADAVVSTQLGAVTVKGTTLEQPPAQATGGGLNSSLTVALPGGSLAAGANIDVQWVLDVVQNGRFRFYVSVEALP